MEPLITLRLLGSQLKQNELQYMMQQIIKTFEKDKILSFIFNHFLISYNKNKQHDNDLSIIISLIKNILNSRKKNKSNKKDINDKADDNEPIFSLSLMPSEIIGECASYLKVRDYLNFFKSNRKIYVACNSPSKLQKFFTGRFHKYRECDLNQFLSLKTLSLNPNDFDEYINLHPKQKQFYQLNELRLYDQRQQSNNNHNELMKTFINTKCINFENLLYLTCDFGTTTSLYDFNSFCDILMKFTNVIGLNLSRLYLTDFDDENTQISKIFPNLSMLSITNGVGNSVLLLRNKLLNIHSNNIISLLYDESIMEIDITSFPKLKELFARNPNVYSLHKIIKNASGLERFALALENNESLQTKETIITLFKTCSKLEEFDFFGDFVETQKMLKWTEIALLNTSDMICKSITLVFSISCDSRSDDISNIKMDEFNLDISRIINALVASNIKDFMVGIHIPSNSETTFQQSLKIFEKKYLVNLLCDAHSIIISNTVCKINGYTRRWLKPSSFN